MPYTKLLFEDEARAKVPAGATTLAGAVRVTLGPKSKSVLLAERWGAPQICNDGVTIARKVTLEDPEENLGAQMLRQVAVRTGDEVGDGTTTATLLAHAILAEGLRNVVAGASGIDLKRGLERGVRVAVEAVRGQSKPVREKTEMSPNSISSASPWMATPPSSAARASAVPAHPVVAVARARVTAEAPAIAA